MKSLSLKKYTVCIFSCFLLFFFLYMSINYEDFGSKIIKSITNTIIAATKTDQSSTSTTKPSGSDMVDLLARLVNGEARGETYQRSGCCCSSGVKSS